METAQIALATCFLKPKKLRRNMIFNDTNQCCQWKIVKQISKNLPYVGITVPTQKKKEEFSLDSWKLYKTYKVGKKKPGQLHDKSIHISHSPNSSTQNLQK